MNNSKYGPNQGAAFFYDENGKIQHPKTGPLDNKYLFKKLGGYPALYDAFVLLSDKGCFLKDIAEYLGMDRNTLTIWIQEDDYLKLIYRTCQANTDDLVLNKLVELVNGVKVEVKNNVYKRAPDIRAINTFLKLRGMITEKQEKTVKAEIISPDTTIKELTRDQLKALLLELDNE